MGLKRGDIECLTRGSYSDFYIVGHVRALRDISNEEWNAVRARHDYKGDAPHTVSDFGDRTNAYSMLAEMAATGWIEDAIEVRELGCDDRLGEAVKAEPLLPPPAIAAGETDE
jgi:hypothetical protein